MNTTFGIKQFGLVFAAFIIICIGNIIIVAQGKSEKRNFCSENNWSWNDRESVNELREVTIAAVGSLTVDGKNNGGISVKGENRNDILIRSCVQAWAKTDEAATASMKAIRIQTGSSVYAENPNDDKNWSVSYEILVPNRTNLDLKARNGGISITSVEGTIEFFTQNGGVSLKDLAGNVKGKTTNGGLSVRLAGNSWNGEGLDVETKNGGVNFSLEENYAANIETGTVNGGIKSEVNELQVEKKDDDSRGYYRQNKRINKSINGGGAKVRIVTTNGGVVIRKN
jgi:hypothetical protein